MYYVALLIMWLPVISAALLVLAIGALTFVGSYHLYDRFRTKSRKRIALELARSESE